MVHGLMQLGSKLDDNKKVTKVRRYQNCFHGHQDFE